MNKTEEQVMKILTEIRSEGIKAVKKYCRIFDGYDENLKVSENEIKDSEAIPEKEKYAISKMIERVRKFHVLQKENSTFVSENGSVMGILIKPITRVGIYVPGGKPLPSSLIMSAIPAQIAGVKEIIVTSPPKNGKINKRILYTAKLLGIKEIYKIGGAQAIGAMAFGIGIKKVDKIVGPGNKYVAEAKRQVFGICGIDKIAGPSEICIVADKTASPVLVQADIEAQLEHGEETKAYLFTTDKVLYEKIYSEKLVKKLCKTIEECISESNKIAPEHLEILTENPISLLSLVENAGAVYLGENTPTAAGDYFVGTNHVLPTNGTARFSSALGVWDFVKRINVAQLSQKSFSQNKFIGITLSETEGLNKHKKSLEVRI